MRAGLQRPPPLSLSSAQSTKLPGCVLPGSCHRPSVRAGIPCTWNPGSFPSAQQLGSATPGLLEGTSPTVGLTLHADGPAASRDLLCVTKHLLPPLKG